MLKKMIVVLGVVGTVLAACSGGGGQPQECADYVECAKKIGANASPDTVEAAYGANGSCFVGGAGDVCKNACESGLSGLKTGFPDAGC